ncbi:hypothetical protein [Nocardioides sp. T2.26MG-1]|uniref:hypothetical protein n=1 Tax=Nocardioides sp. T2.26MG-1 TaxID=3041166 RepID=UPI002477AA0A|nr:hypothetical protein [Nocardioides sp. T2.26MG-1]CAI9417288.1 hypothetical protein HIDPHFAB_02983 [Nocardioides sp. T2.26MG-1]
MRGLVDWLLFAHLPLTPLGLFGVVYWSRWIGDRLDRWIERRTTDVIDLPSGGRIVVRGYPDEMLAEIVEQTGGTLRPRRSAR